VMASIVEPTLRELHARDIHYRGVLYAGLMLTSRGPTLLEYNVRFGDPEAEVLAPLYGAGLFDLLANVASGTLDGAPSPATGSAVTVVLASYGYPASARHGDVIHGLGDDGQLEAPHEGVVLFHSGTKRDDHGRFVTAGGRVLAVTGVASNVSEAHRRAYLGASLVNFEGKVTRSDIARSAI